MAYEIDRPSYAAMFGPTVGDKVRLADTDLIIEVEKDFTTLGEEVKFGGGKVIRDGMGQSQVTRADGAVDTVITNALILDYTGIIKADIGIRDGRIAAVGKAGNPESNPVLISSLVRAPKLSPVKATSLPLAALMRTSTGFARNRLKTRFIPVSPACWVVEPARRRGPMRRPAHPVRGTLRGCFRLQTEFR